MGMGEDAIKEMRYGNHHAIIKNRTFYPTVA